MLLFCTVHLIHIYSYSSIVWLILFPNLAIYTGLSVLMLYKCKLVVVVVSSWA